MSGREVLNKTMSDTQRTSVAEVREEAGRSMEISPSQVRVALDSGRLLTGEDDPAMS